MTWRLLTHSCFKRSVYTASVTSSVTNYHEENGRRYHAYREGRESPWSHHLVAVIRNPNHLSGYLLPNDEKENERLDIHSAMINNAMGDRLFFAPIGDKPQRVIDICTGTGIWAIDFGRAKPASSPSVVSLPTNKQLLHQLTNSLPLR